MSRVPVNGISLATRVGPGEGPAVVAIHGLTANHTCWFPIAEALAPAARVIAYDLRGRGDSEKPAHGYSLAEHGRDLLGLLDHFKLDRAVIMGHSLGAHLAVRIAVHHPDRVAKLVLVDGGLRRAGGRARLPRGRHRASGRGVPVRGDVPGAHAEAPDVRHYTIVLGEHPLVIRELRAFLAA